MFVFAFEGKEEFFEFGEFSIGVVVCGCHFPNLVEFGEDVF